jgi:hypothetical protein
MKRPAPPYLLDCLLLALLSPRDRETVSGDLHEEFLEVKLPQLGLFRARLWYLRQVLSFIPAKAAAVLQPPLKLLCFFTANAGGWLAMVDLLSRHPGSAIQILIAATIVSQAVLTLAALRFHRLNNLRVAAMIGSVAVLWIACSALKATLSGSHFEGYILLIALALILQAALTLLTLPGARVPPGKSA